MTLPVTDPVLIFAGIMLLILLGPLAARKLGLPEIIGLIIAGIVFGPHGLGIFARNQIMILLGTVGILYIMFMAGLEIDLNQLRKNFFHTLLFGMLTFTVPLLLGILLGMKLFAMSFPVALLLASMFSSHTLVTYPAVGKLGLTKTRSVTTTLGGTIVTDSLAMLILAVVAGMAAAGAMRDTGLVPRQLHDFISGSSGLSAHFWIIMFAKMGLYVAAMMALIPFLARRFFRNTGNEENRDFIFVLVITFTSGFLAHVAGMEPIIGAFIAGLTLNSLIPEKSLLMHRIHFTGDAIFIPFFLISVGMLVDVSLLFKGSAAWVITAGMVGTALLSKWLAAMATQKILGYTLNEGWLLFGMSVNQAAATLAAVLVGYNLGLFSEEIITGTIMMIAVTCLAGSLVTDRAGRKVALDEEQKAFDPGTAPQRILLPVSGSQGSRDIMDLAFLLHDKKSGEPLYPIHVTDKADNYEETIARAESVLSNSIVRSSSAGIPAIPLTSMDINKAAGILRAARENRISLVLFSWDGQQQARSRVFNRTIDAVVEEYKKAVMINRLSAPVNTARRIVLVLPPLAGRHIGFAVLLRMVKNLSGQAGTTILAVTGSDCSHETIREALEDVTFAPAHDWKKTHEYLSSLLLPTDWIILMNVRKGKLIWQPYLDRLPGMLAAQYPALNLSSIFPPVEMEGEPPLLRDESADAAILVDPDRSIFRIADSDPGTAVNRLLEKYFDRKAVSTKLMAETLRKIARDEPVELSSDVVLLHTHVPYVRESLLFLGTFRKPLKLPLVSGAARILIILLEPADQEPSLHLNALATIVRCLRKPGMIGTLLAARSFRQVQQAIKKLS